MSMLLASPLARYREDLKRQDFVADAAQERAIRALDERCTALLSTPPGRDWLGRRRPWSPVSGLYLWGGVGRGKTFLMDLFFESLAIRNKRRSHFHRMMSEVHSRLKLADNVEDPLDRVAGDIASETSVLCFDEFFVEVTDTTTLFQVKSCLFHVLV